MLTQPETEFITGQLIAAISLQASPRQHLITGLIPDLQSLLADGLAPVVLVDRAISLCISDAYRHTPPALAVLLRTLLGTQERIPEIVNRISSPPPPPPNPFDALVLDNKLPFLGRSAARAHFRALTQALPVQSIIVINGDPNTGKSYTAEFIDYLCRQLTDVQHFLVSLQAQQGASTGPRELAVDIVGGIGGDPSKLPPANTNLDRWAQELATWIIAEANASAIRMAQMLALPVIRWWIVLDGFNPRELRPDTRLLIDKLANGLVTGLAQRLQRLILIDFDRTVLTVRPGTIASEMTGGIPGSSVTACITQILRDAPQLAPDQIMTKIMEGFADPITDLPELAKRLSDLITIVEGRQP